MRTFKFLTLFFLLLPSGAFAQWEVETRHAASLQSDNDFLPQSDLFYRDNLMLSRDFSSFNPSGDFLTNIFGSSYLETGLSTDDGHRNHLAISSIPLGNGIIFLLIISVLYFTVLLTKKHLLKMQTTIHPSQSPLKGRLWLTQNVENSQTLKAPFRGLGGKLFLFFLLFCGTNTYAQLPFKAVPDNAFVLPNSTDSTVIQVLRNDELGMCTETGIQIAITQPAKHGGADVYSGATGDTIKYKPAAGYTGQDTLQYTITCDVTSAPVLVLINVDDKPDNIYDDICAITPIPVSWGMTYIETANANHCPYAIPVVGDIDSDGIVEILVSTDPIVNNTTAINGVTIARPSSKITIYKGNDLTAPTTTINTVKPYYWSGYMQYSIVRTQISGIDTTLIVVCEGDRYLRAYYPTGTLAWTSSVVYHASTTYQSIVSFADFNKDGIPEILTNGKLFNSANGQLLCSITETLASCIAADLYNDGTLNYIAGNLIYDVNPGGTWTMTLKKNITPPTIKRVGSTETGIADPDYTSATAWTVPAGGHVSAVDMDHDGQLELIVRVIASPNIAIYIVDPRTGTNGTIRAAKYISGTTGSYPFVGDIDGDDNNEIILIKLAGSGTTGGTLMFAYKYIPGNPVLTEFWRLSHLDASGTTGITLFDFDQDGIAELVYRDETELRILDGTANGAINYPDRNKTVMPSKSGTGWEYPVVADVDGDGQSEILIVGGTPGEPGGMDYWLGPLRIYKSDDPASPWAPARKVWNQYAYNPVYVNKDVTIPANPLNPATFFINSDGTTHQPFNNFLQQATSLNDEGKMLQRGPDLTFDTNEGDNNTGVQIVQNGNDYDVDIWVTNEGDAAFPSPLTVNAYGFTGSGFAKLSVTPNPIPIGGGSIAVGETKQLMFKIIGAVSKFVPTNIQIRLNEDNNILPVGMEECRYANNYYNTDLYGVPDQVLCEGDSTVYFYPLNSPLDYSWYTDPTSIDPSDFLETNKGKLSNSALFVKDGNAQQSLYVDVYDGTTKKTVNRIEVKIFHHSDSLIWTGLGNTQDWHDPANWLNPDLLSPAAGFSLTWIPRPCTHVLIPDGINIYPDLSENVTDRMIYNEASCDHILFEFGGEVARTDSLHYTKAWIQYNFGYYNAGGTITDHPGYENTQPTSVMDRDQWYALSAPLKKIVTGDFSLGGKPHTWQKRFIRSDVSGTFTGAFDWPDDNIKPNNEAELNDSLGYAIALLVADNNPGYNGEDWSGGYQAGLDTLKGIITLPYFEGPYDESDFDNSASHIHPHRVHQYDTGSKTSFFKEYWYYDTNLALTTHPQGSILREDEAYRFIFDNQIVPIPSGTLIGKNAFKITVPTGKEIMLGNPFMSSLKFNNFYQANSTAINNYFRLYNGTFNTYEYNVGSVSITDTITVLQAFFITTTGTPGSTVDLYFPFETTSITRETGKAHYDYFKSPKANNDVIYVTATSHANKNKATSATLAINQEGQNVYQLFYEASNNIPQVYFTDESGQKNAVQYSTENENQATTIIPLGLRSGFGNRITLTFDINADVEALTLLDKKTGQTQDLLQNNSYTFTQSDNTTPYIDRFALSFKSPTAISEIKNESKIAIYQDDETVTVSSPEKINSVELFDMQGRRIKQADQIENNVYQMNLRRGVARNAPTGVYIVKAVLGNGEAQTHKIIVK
ncbi:hypothetical protein AGMMS50262_03530 [Bacteroidia bacterium]|nr:hypothetical protein AGMMS50262_03530 [Bacteroidia bacterium]